MSKKAGKRSARPLPPPAPPAAPRAWKVPAAIVVLCAALYGWTLRFPMVFDDDTYLLNNPFFHAESFGYPFRFHEFVTAPGRMGLDPDLAVNLVTRRTTEVADLPAEALKKDPANAFSHRLLGIIRAEQGRLRESLTHFREASRQLPGDADLREKVFKLEQHLASN